MSSIEGMDGLVRRMNALSSGATRKALMTTVGVMAVAESKRTAPRKTSNLSRSIRLGAVSEDKVSIIAGGVGGVGYAAHVHQGTRPHIIRPRNRKALRFAVGANARLTGSPRSGAPTIFARFVRHPGTKANPYLVRGAQSAIRKVGLAEPLTDAWNKAS